jgi:hypothetical protein
MDCRSWGWAVESRRYADKECCHITVWEDKYGVGKRQERELEELWSGELMKRKVRAEMAVTVVEEVAVPPAVNGDGAGSVTKKIETVSSVVDVRAFVEEDIPKAS